MHLFLLHIKRLSSVIFPDRTNMNLTMIKAGLAEVYRSRGSGHPYTPQCQTVEVAAQSGRPAMWVLGDTYESPSA